MWTKPTTAKTKTPVPGGEVEVARAAQEIQEVRAGEAHEAALEDLPGPVDSRNATVAFATRAGGARETGENFFVKVLKQKQK